MADRDRPITCTRGAIMRGSSSRGYRRGMPSADLTALWPLLREPVCSVDAHVPDLDAPIPEVHLTRYPAALPQHDEVPDTLVLHQFVLELPDPAMTSGSRGTFLCPGPLRTVRATRRGTRLKQALMAGGRVAGVCGRRRW